MNHTEFSPRLRLRHQYLHILINFWLSKRTRWEYLDHKVSTGLSTGVEVYSGRNKFSCGMSVENTGWASHHPIVFEVKNLTRSLFVSIFSLVSWTRNRWTPPPRLKISAFHYFGRAAGFSPFNLLPTFASPLARLPKSIFVIWFCSGSAVAELRPLKPALAIFFSC